MTTKVTQILEYLDRQGIIAQQVNPLVAFLDPHDELVTAVPAPLPFAKQSERGIDISDTKAESMSFASMLAVLQIDEGADKVLDVCAAPGMKGLYLSYVRPGTSYFCNDVSADRLSRLKRLFLKHGRPIANMTHYDARFIERAYEPGHFDTVLIDAPCSGEGVALSGDESIAAAWSPAKVKRLQQLQVGIIKSAWKLVSPGGALIYATCTLNKNENERAIKKALGVDLHIIESSINLDEARLVKNGEGFRILPSRNSIGFFISRIVKSNFEH